MSARADGHALLLSARELVGQEWRSWPCSPRVRTSSVPRRSWFTGRPSMSHGKRHVLHHVEHGDEVVELVHHAPPRAGAARPAPRRCARTRPSPFRSTVPDVGRSTPPMRCRSVDLPEPDEPTMATNSPCPMDSVTLSSALSAVGPCPYTFVSRSAERMSIARLSLDSLRNSVPSRPCGGVNPALRNRHLRLRGAARHTTILGNAKSKRAPPVARSLPARSVPPWATVSERASESPMPKPSDPSPR